MRKRMCLLLLAGGSLALYGCASGNTEERLGRLEAQAQGQQMADLRLAHVEDRLEGIESSLGELRSRLDAEPAKGGKGSASKGTAPSPRAAQAPAERTSASAVPVAAAPGAAVKGSEPVSAPSAAVAPVASGAVSSTPPSAAAASGGAQAASPSVELWPGFVGEEYRLQPGGRWVSPPASAHAASSAPASTPTPGQLAAPAPQMAASAPVSAPQTAAASGGGASDKTAYNAALTLYDKNQVAAAEQRFASFLKEYPQSPLTPNAMYWLGECYYSTGKMDSAIMIFKDVAGKFPRHPKAAASLLKAGYAYAKLKDMENARFYWQILLDDFPDSAPAALARKRMAES